MLTLDTVFRRATRARVPPALLQLETPVTPAATATFTTVVVVPATTTAKSMIPFFFSFFFLFDCCFVLLQQKHKSLVISANCSQIFFFSSPWLFDNFSLEKIQNSSRWNTLESDSCSSSLLKWEEPAVLCWGKNLRRIKNKNKSAFSNVADLLK